MKRSAFLGLLAASSLTVLAATNETDVTWDKENSPYAKAIRAGEAEDWGRFRYWVEMISENERDSRIKGWLSQLANKGNPPVAKDEMSPRTKKDESPIAESVKPKLSATTRKTYVGPLGTYVVKRGDTIGKIAYIHGITIRLLKEINGLKGDTLKVGQRFLVPADVTAKCQVRIAAFKKIGIKRNHTLVKEYISVDLTKALPDGISQYSYYKGNGVFDLLLCSEVASDEMFHVKVTSRDLTAAMDVFVQFQEGSKDMEVEVK